MCACVYVYMCSSQSCEAGISVTIFQEKKFVTCELKFTNYFMLFSQFCIL